MPLKKWYLLVVHSFLTAILLTYCRVPLLVIVLYLHSALPLPFVMVNGRRMGHYNRQRRDHDDDDDDDDSLAEVMI